MAGHALAQDGHDSTRYPRIYLSPGIGLEYGGVGVDATVMLFRYFGLHAGIGYNFVGTGANGGGRIYFTRPHSHLRPYFSGIYGYNAAVKVKNTEQYNKIFYGPSFGLGMDIEGKHDNCWTVAFYVPVRKGVVDYLNYLQAGGTKGPMLLPFTLSLGYRIALVKR